MVSLWRQTCLMVRTCCEPRTWLIENNESEMDVDLDSSANIAVVTTGGTIATSAAGQGERTRRPVDPDRQRRLPIRS